MKYIVALDQGTTSSRAVVFNTHADVVSAHSIEFRQIYPKPGWVEHDPYDILQSQKDALRYAVQKAQIDAADIAAIGISNQRETTLAWNRISGKPVHNAIVWQCRRTAEHCSSLLASGLAETIRQKTGLVIDAYFSATKLSWILKNIPEAKKLADQGDLCFGTVDSFLLWHLTGGKAHATDYTNAARTMLLNIHTLDWDDDLLGLFQIPRSVLPAVIDTSCVAGYLEKSVLGREIPIASLAGDQQAALFGQGCVTPGMVKNTYGTGCFVLMNTGGSLVRSNNRLLTTIGWKIGHETAYALEGSVFVGGAVVQWLRDELKIIENAAQTEQIAQSIEHTGGVVLVPAFTGLGAPYWDMYARGILVGLTRGTGRPQIVRAALESIAFQSCDVIEAMKLDSKIALSQLRVDGGASQNAFLMQFQADLLGVSVRRPAVIETTALGAALFAGLAVGCFDQASLSALITAGTEFIPSMPQNEAEAKRAVWKRAVARARLWQES